MDLILKLVNLCAKTPDWVLLYVLPALLLAAAVGFVFAPKRRWYYCPATILIAVSFIIAYSKDASFAFIYLGILVALCALLSLLFLIPRPKRREGKVKKSRVDELYEKFHAELSEQPYTPRSVMPPKVCCFEKDAEAGATAGERGMDLNYADSLIEKLRTKDLTAGDRLEAEALARRLDCYRDKPLTESERDTLNDCLAAILKLTAKYQL